MLHVTRLTQNQNDSKIVQREGCLYLLIRLRTIKVFQYKSLLLFKPPQTTRRDIQHCITEKKEI